MPGTRIKICGITRTEDALAAERAGCDAVGFVFYEKSKRHVTSERAREILTCLPSEFLTVGVFVDPTVEIVRETVKKVGLIAAQLHNPSSNGDWKSLAAHVQLILAVGIREGEPVDVHEVEGVNDYIFDNHDDETIGGTGKTFDWTYLRKRPCKGRVWLAGGLNASNVGRAIQMVHPYAVDVSTGVESAPGIKSAEKIAEFIEAVRAADHQLSGNAAI